jgi:hypothetical protein
LGVSTVRTLAIETSVSRASQIKLTAAKPVPTKAWSERRARERNPKRVILKAGRIGGEGKEEKYTRREKEVSRGDHTLQFSQREVHSVSEVPGKLTQHRVFSL